MSYYVCKTLEEEERLDNAINRIPCDITTSIKSWYTYAFPTDEEGERLNNTATFLDIVSDLVKGDDIYEALGAGDSVIRERIFTKLAHLLNCDYGNVYDLWIK